MKRRDFFKGLGGVAAVWPAMVSAQQIQRVRRVGVLMNVPADDPQGQVYVAEFQKRMEALGWSIGHNLRIDRRWALSNTENFQKSATELVALEPEVILAAGAAVLGVQRANRHMPVVFSQSIDPVGAGFVANLARPGGNITGFMSFEYSLSGKWLQLLKEIAPDVTRVGVLRDVGNPAGIGQWAVIQAAAETIGIEASPLAARDPAEIERGIAAFQQGGGGGLIVSVSSRAIAYREHIIASAARHRLPTVYPYRHLAIGGGLVSYGPNLIEQYQRAAEYVDRILKGERPADLPVQRPTRYEMVINLKTATSLGLIVPPTLLARADEVIE